MFRSLSDAVSSLPSLLPCNAKYQTWKGTLPSLLPCKAKRKPNRQGKGRQRRKGQPSFLPSNYFHFLLEKSAKLPIRARVPYSLPLRKLFSCNFTTLTYITLFLFYTENQPLTPLFLTWNVLFLYFSAIYFHEGIVYPDSCVTFVLSAAGNKTEALLKLTMLLKWLATFRT